MSGNNKGFSYFLGMAVSAGALMSAPIAIAQESVTASGADDADEVRTYDTVTVTAQRREESLTDVPIAISAVSDETLEKAGLNDINALQQIVPGLTFNFAGAHFQPTIRGVGTQVSGPGLPSNVAIYVDGFYRPNAVMNNFQLNDVESVQVLKGPQGTLYGRNATGGAVLLSTRSPEFEAAVDASVSYRSFDDLRAGAFLTGPLSDSLAGSLAFYSRTAETFNDNLVPNVADKEKRTTVTRGKLLFEPQDTFSLELTVEHSDIYDPSTFMFSNYEGISVGNFVTGALVADQPYTYSNDYRPIFDSESTGVFLSGTFDLGWATLTSLTSHETQKNYSGYDVDGSSVNIQHVDFSGDQETTAQEFILASPDGGKIDWIAGAFLFEDQGNQALFVALPTGGFFEVSDGGVKTQSFALYADVTYEFAPDWFVNGGTRFSQDHLDEYFTSAFTQGLTEADKTFSDITPRIGIRHQLSDTSSLYATYNAGYKTGGFNPTSASTAFVRPEKIDAFEIGYKTAGSLWDMNLAAFHYAYDDLQVTAYQGPVTSLVNAAKAEIYGAEVDVAFRPTDRLSLSGAVSYVNATYEDFPGAPQYTYDPVTGITVAPGDASGNPVVNSPELTANLNANYVQPVEFGELEASANLSYQSDTYFDAFSITEQPEYVTLNVRLGWRSKSDVWGIGLFANNVTDEEYVRSIFQQPVAFSSSWAAPRVVGVELTFRN